MASLGPMTSGEIKDRMEKSGDTLPIAVEKWIRLGKRFAWQFVKGKKGVERYLKSDTCPLCRVHSITDSNGPKEWSHCLGEYGYNPCPLVDSSENNVAGCGPESIWMEARGAAERGDRPAFMKARAKILRRLRAAKAWY